MINEAICELIEETIGKDIVRLIELLLNKENISEIKLADKLKITVNQARNMLYRLDEHNLVTFTRKKDKEKGWYIYYWTLDGKKAVELLQKHYQSKLEMLNTQLKREKDNEFFICPEKCIRLKLEDALEHDFKCPECEKVLEKEDNTKRIERIKKDIQEMSKKIEESKDLEYKRPKKKSAKKKKPKKKPKKKKAKKKPKKKKPKKKPKKKKYTIEKRKSKSKKRKSTRSK